MTTSPRDDAAVEVHAADGTYIIVAPVLEAEGFQRHTP